MSRTRWCQWGRQTLADAAARLACGATGSGSARPYFAEWRTSHLMLAIVGALVLTSCSSDVTGNVFVRMKSGDAKRTADVEVVLVSHTPQFESAWAQGIQQFKAAYANVDDAFRETKRQVESLQRSDAVATYRAALARRDAAATEIDRTVIQYQEHAVKLIRWGQAHSGRTDANGHYELKAVRSGKYFLFAHVQVFDTDLYWMVPIQVGSGAHTYDLSNSNLGWPFTVPWKLRAWDERRVDWSAPTQEFDSYAQCDAVAEQARRLGTWSLCDTE